MKIKNIKINNYGNLENKEINLINKINIIYGKNESGKSTLLNYIKNIFYGISKNKNGKNISDYEKYKSWGKEEYSGKIKYELDNGEIFEIFRDFHKKNPKIFNSNMEEISKEFNIVKKDGVQFFFDQTNVDETMFTSTVLAMQEEIKLGKQEQNILVQKLANLAGTGDDNLSYQKLIDKLNKMQIEEVGSERSQGRPINIVRERMKNIEFVLKELLAYQKDKDEVKEKQEEYEEEIRKAEQELNLLEKLNIIKLWKQQNQEKIEIKNNYLKEKNKKIEELNFEKNNLLKKIEEKKDKRIIDSEKIKENNYNKKEKNEKNKLKKNKLNKNKLNKKTKKYFLILFFILIINIIIFILNNNFIKNNYLFIFHFLWIPIYFIIIFLLEKNNNDKMKKEIQNENEKIFNEIDLINRQIELLEEEKKVEQAEIEQEQKEIDNKVDVELENIKQNYRKELDVNKYLEKAEENDISYWISELQKSINQNNIELQTIKIQEENIQKKLESMIELKEEYANLEEEIQNLQERNESIELTKKLLTKAYINMKDTITPKFTENLSQNIAKISKGKYTKVGINDEKGLMVENEYGEYIPAELLSVGTIDQLYLSLRLSMIDELSKEKMPIMLDEAFAYYDDERLENIIKFLSDNMKEHQVLIFTCTKREQEMLTKLNIEYNLVELGD